MGITVEGIMVRNDEVSCNVEVPFSGLNLKGQKRLFLENKDLFLCKALDSSYEYIFDLAHKNLKNCSSSALNEAIVVLLKRGNVDLILEILAIPHFSLKDSIRTMLSKSEYYSLVLWVANDSNTSYELLCDMLLASLPNVFWNRSFDIFVAIISNANFKLYKKTYNAMVYFSKVLELSCIPNAQLEYSKIEKAFKDALESSN